MTLVDLGLYADDGTETLAAGGPFGLARSGPARLAERVGYELALEPGSVAGRTAGTGLTAAVRGAATGLDLAAAFSTAARQVIDVLAAAETADTPDDERVMAVFLTDVTIVEGAAALEITVVTAAAGVAVQSLVVEIPPEE